jgi:hypothetical protein
MGIRIYSHNKALELLQNSFHGLAYKELVEFLHRIPLIRFAEKSSNTAGLEFLQTCMNQLLNDVLKLRYGWHTQVDMPGGLGENNVDFYKKWSHDLRVWMEVEFGNVARLDSDIRKLRSAFERKLSEIGILLVPTQRLARRFDLNVASFERAVTLLSVDKSNSYPVLVVGIELDDSKVIDVTNWGYPLNELKGSSYLEVKSHLAQRVWEEHMLPTLPANSMHTRHVELTKVLGYNPAERKPVFKGFIPEVVPTPEIFTLNDDGTLATFEDIPKESKAKTTKPRQMASGKKAPMPSAKPTASWHLNPPQLELALAVASEPKNLPCIAESEPATAPQLELALDETSLREAKRDEAPPAQLPAPASAQPSAESQHTAIAEVRSLSAAPIVVPPAPPAAIKRPAQPSSNGPRLGPWLSRMGAAASPFVTSFA